MALWERFDYVLVRDFLIDHFWLESLSTFPSDGSLFVRNDFVKRIVPDRLLNASNPFISVLLVSSWQSENMIYCNFMTLAPMTGDTASAPSAPPPVCKQMIMC